MQILIFTLISLIIPLFAGGEKPKPVENKHVTFSAAVNEQSLKAGSTGTVKFSLTPAKGIHINLDPPMSIDLDTTSVFTNNKKLNTPKDNKTGYLDVSTPVTTTFTINKAAKPGTYTLKGVFTYFYCSDAEGWCNRFKQPIELTVKVTK